MELCVSLLIGLATWFGAQLLLQLIFGMVSGAASAELLPRKKPVEPAPAEKPARRRKGKGE